EDTTPRYLLRDRDRIYGPAFRRRVDGLGIREVLTAARSPCQNPYAERVIGSIRRECLDHVTCSTSSTCAGPFGRTSGITITPGATSPSPGTRRLAAPPKGRSRVRSSPSRRSADSIIATNGGRHDRGWVSGRDRTWLGIQGPCILIYVIGVVCAYGGIRRATH